MGLTPEDQITVSDLITERTDKGPATIMRFERADFFKAHYNSCEGWFVWVRFPQGLWEIWFVVELSGCCDQDWHLQKVT